MNRLNSYLYIAALALLLQGCIAFPPLIQVEHKDSPPQNQEILKRLDAIDHRLDAIEKADKKP
jgi:starvation-inducible outer membrane lipoprotein